MGFIYKITNKANGKLYVGQTFRNVGQRFDEHLRMSRKDKIGYRSLLYAAIKKYGKENFTVETLEECEDDKLNEREIYWIETLRTCETGYNISLGIQKNPHYHVSDLCNLWRMGFSAREIGLIVGISTQIVTKRLKENGITKGEIISRGSTKEHSTRKHKAVVRISIDGTETKVYQSLLDASKDNNTSTGGICEACQGKKQLAGGYRWVYYEGEETLKDIKPMSISHCIREVHQYTKDGQYIRSFNSLSDARRFMGKTTVNTIMIACRDIKHTAYGYRWSYEKQDKLQVS